MRIKNVAFLLLCVLVLATGCMSGHTENTGERATYEARQEKLHPPPLTLDKVLANKNEGSFAGDRYDVQAVQEKLQQMPRGLSTEKTYAYLLSLVGETYSKYRGSYAYIEDPGYRQQELYLDPNAPVTVAVSEVNKLKVEVILDCSGSMAGSVQGGVKMDLAKKAISDFLAKLPPGTQAGLRVFGHKGSTSKKDRAEGSQTELVYPISTYDEKVFNDSMQRFSPRGWTPIAKSLYAAGQDLAAQKEEGAKYIIYLVSDGIETCGGNPVAAASSLHQSGIQAVVNIIGFDVDDKVQRQLKEAAAAGGGNYVTVKSQEELQGAFQAELKTRNYERFKNDQVLLKKASLSMSETSAMENIRLKVAVAYIKDQMDYEKWTVINKWVLERWTMLNEYRVKKNIYVSKKILDDSF